MKPRIVGAMVLAALAVILLPMLLDFDGEYIVDTRSQIPARPDIVPVEIAPPEAVDANQDGQTADEMFRFDRSRAEAENNNDPDKVLNEQAPGLNDKGVPESWILQIASFSDEAKANSLTEQLLADQYRAFSRASTVKGKPIYRVYVGPKILKKDMLDEKKAIERKHKLETLLLRFEP